MAEKIKVVIAGINGKMGRASARAILADEELKIVGAFGRAGAPYANRDIGELASTLNTGILVSNQFQDVLDGVAPDVLLDFTRAEAAVPCAEMALDNGVRPVIGTSGLNDAEIERLAARAQERKTGAMIVPNFSVGAVLMMEFARQAGRLYDNCEIVEMHHTGKVDAPSGTAMHTVRKLESAGHQFNPRLVEERELLGGSRGGRSQSGLRVHSLRLPGLISHQEVIFGSDGELLTIRHDSFNTNCFIRGILLAVKAVMKMDRLEVGLEKLLLTA